MERHLGRYRLVRHLATGGMGEVWLAEAEGAAGFSKRVVVKTLRAELVEIPGFVEQFIAEGRLLERLNHPNIAQILDLGEADGTYFLAMEQVEGYDLRSLEHALPTDERGRARLPEDAVLAAIHAVGRALDHAATRPGPNGRPLRIVHHDVTPSNVMVTREGLCKLVDFGVARRAELDKLGAGALRGKLPYLSPEHASLARVDGRSDLFSLGVMAFEALCGERPFLSSEIGALRQEFLEPHAHERVLVEAGAGPGVTALVLALLSVDPDDRPANAAALVARTEALFAGRLVAPERTLSEALRPAFARLDAEARSFDRQLAGTLGLGAHVSRGEVTASLPGLGESAMPAILAAAARTPARTPASPEREQERIHTTRRRYVVIAAIGGALASGAGVYVALSGTQEPEPQRIAVSEPSLPAAPPALSAPNDPRQPDPPPAVVVPVATALPVPPSLTAAPPASEAPAKAPAVADKPRGKAEPEARPPRRVPRATSRPADRAELPESEPARLSFRVFPANARVSIDDKAVVTREGKVVASLAAGEHVVLVTDPATKQSKRVRVTLKAGEKKTLPNGVAVGAEFGPE